MTARRPSRKRGFALLLVLLLVSIAMVVVTQLAFQADYELLAAHNVSDMMQIEYAIDGQLEVVLGQLRYDKRQNDATDTEYDEWNSERMRSRRDGDVGLETRVIDEQGKFWVGSLVTGTDARKARAKEVLVRILDLFRDGISEDKTRGGDLDIADAEEIAGRIVRYMTREGASGQVPKPSTTGAAGANDVPMLLDELLFVDTKDSRLFQTLLYDQQVKEVTAAGLHRYLTVYGPGKVNLNTAPLVVLKAHFSNVSDRDYAQKIIDRRRQSPESSSTGSSAMSGSPSTTTGGSSGGNPFSAVTELTDGSIDGLNPEVLQRNGIDPALDFDVKSDWFTVRIEGATERTQRTELYALERVETKGFRFLLHQERTDRMLELDEDAVPTATE
ncbi:MAG: general secretion pathway protein GspK [Planctomycetia bacterium]|nr:general secretion pathway protein GspK [Planctomycetia bacterium]